jgi:protein-S-isoprenylcysteine O-methyltransferase Ste14
MIYFGVFCFVMLIYAGYMIRFRDKPHWIAGYSENAVKDKEGLKKWAGNNLMLLGFVSLLIPVILLYIPYSIYSGMFYTLFLAVWIFLIVIGAQRY